MPPSRYTVAITEIMGNPCGDEADQQANEYVELYNYGEYPMDVKGWYFMASNNQGNPDEIITWDTRNPYSRKLASNLITDSTIQSVQRRIASQGDIHDNWEVLTTPNPGSGPY